MIFWDTSCIIPLLVAEPMSPVVRGILDGDPSIVVWWATPVDACRPWFAWNEKVR